MNNIEVYIDSCADLTSSEIKDLKVNLIPLYYYFDNENIEYGDKINLKMSEFFKRIEEGFFPRTSSCNIDNIYNRFKEDILNNKDIICINISSKLSSSYNNCLLAASMLKEEFKDANIHVIDSLSGSIGEFLTLYDVLNKKGSFKEIINYVENNKKLNHIEFFVDDLKYLTRNGRLSKTAGFIGKTLNIKPLIGVKKDGSNELITKVRGEKKIYDTLINRMLNNIGDNNIIGIVHSNSLDKANILKEKIEKLQITKKIMLSEIGPVIASHIGPGAIGLAYKLKKN